MKQMEVLLLRLRTWGRSWRWRRRWCGLVKGCDFKLVTIRIVKEDRIRDPGVFRWSKGNAQGGQRFLGRLEPSGIGVVGPVRNGDGLINIGDGSSLGPEE